MKRMTWIRLVLLAVLAALLNACQLPGAPSYPPAELALSGRGVALPQPAPPPSQPLSPLAYAQPVSPLANTQPPSPLAAPAENHDCVGIAGLDGYQMVRRTEIRLTQADGSIPPNGFEDSMLVTRTEGQNCNSHMATGFFDPQTGKRDVISESYAVDDFLFAFCAMCSPGVSDVWRVSKRTTGSDPSLNPGPAGPFPVPVPVGLTPLGIGPFEVDTLVAGSSVVGDEEMNGFATVHRLFTARGPLTEAARWLVGAAPHDPLEVTTAQIDMWLTPDTGRLVRLVFAAEGKSLPGGGPGALLPFELKEEFNFTAVPRNTPIVVPPAVLAVVADQLEELKGD